MNPSKAQLADDSQMLQTPMNVSPVQNLFCKDAQLAPEISLITRLLRPKANAELLTSDLSIIAAKSYFDKMVCELDGYSSSDSGCEQKSKKLRISCKPMRDCLFARGSESFTSESTAFFSSCDQDVHPTHSEKRKRENQEFLIQIRKYECSFTVGGVATENKRRC